MKAPSSWEFLVKILVNCILFESYSVIFIYIIWKRMLTSRTLFNVPTSRMLFNKEEFLAKASGFGVSRLYDSKMSNSIDSRLSSLKELMSM